MRILLVSYSGYGAWFTLRLREEGHSVDYYLLDKKYENVLAGIAPSPFFTKPKFEDYDLVFFDLTGKPKLAEESMLLTPTLGDSNLQSQLEDDRLFGIQIMEDVGINVPPYEVFSTMQEAKRFIRKTNKRYVFKPFGGQEQETNATYVSTSAEDLLDYLDKLSAITGGVEFLLQEVVEGIEISTEGWFNGEKFYLINSTLEEKKFMNEGHGPNTGCAGNLVWTYEQEPRIFEDGLGKMAGWLKDAGYRGMIDLNVIVSPTKVYGLEWTPRFGYDATSTLFALLQSDLGELLYATASGDNCVPIINSRFAASIRLSIPPYPSEVAGKHPKGVPVNGLCLDEDDIARDYYLYDVMEQDECLVTAGCSGFVISPIGVGLTIAEAFAVVNEKIKKLKIPDCQYRTDLEDCVTKRYLTLEAQGWLR